MAAKKQNLKTLSDKELSADLAKAREELRKVHFSAEGSRSKNVKESLTMRRQIARILTEINAR